VSVDAAAAALVAAWHGGPPLAALPEDSVPRDISDGYEVQERVAAGIGGDVVGWKLAVVTAQAQAAAGLSAPTVGPILASMLGASGHRFAPGALRQPEIEPEIALVLARDIAGPADADQVRAATAEVRLAMEVADTRYVRKPVYGQPGIIADMNACAALLLGPVVDPAAAAAAPIRVRLGDGAIVTGFAPGARPDPFAAVAFLSGFLAARGRSLHAGDVITTGTCAPPTRTAPGRVTCEFEGLGEVETIIG
jgi:2-keto-4-pentenoate hydratase